MRKISSLLILCSVIAVSACTPPATTMVEPEITSNKL
ncbi:hypothetical protein THS5294_01439 [Thalassobacter stenotrophicus]|uniref:Uncharacterized protein n=1 Tax=Thalassobacter stenotrophicus TaxID=266809 RepID=A0A0P1EYD5_9RHOB|nr:hypothetical protein THS5294_01439 [Thalassobacter stenotrophicus]